MNVKYLLALLLCLFTASVLASPGAHGPNGEHLDTKAQQSNTAIGRQADGSVIMPMKHQALLKIETQLSTVNTANKHVELPGIIKPHPSGYAVVQPSNDGRLDAPEQGVLNSGTKVTAGDIVGYVRYQYTAVDLANQTSELVAVRNQIEQVHRDVRRLKQLAELASKQDLEHLETQLITLKQQEQALREGIETSEVLIAPISGVIINNSVSRGQWVEAGKTLFEIVSPEAFMVQVTTSDMELLDKLSTASIAHLPNIKLNYVGHSPELVNGLIHLNFEHKTSGTQPVTFLNQVVTVHAPINETIRGIVLPEEAVVLNTNNLPQVWIKLSAERFLPQIVEYQKLEPGFVIVTAGLGEDNRVVVRGSTLLNQVR